MIKKFLVSITFITSLFGFDFSNVSKAIDLKKAKDSIKQDEAKKAIKKGKDITLKDVSNSIDQDKAKSAINEKEMKKIFKF